MEVILYWFLHLHWNVTFCTEITVIPDEGCRTVRIHALVQGYTEVIATYSVRGVDLESVVTVAAYDPLQVSIDISLAVYE